MFFLFILLSVIFLVIIVAAINTAKIEIEIKNLLINTENPKGEKINKDSDIYTYILIFNKIKLFKKKVRNLKFKNKSINIEPLKNKDLKIDYKKFLKNVQIKEIDLLLQIGTQDAALTAILVGIISSLLGIFLRKPKYDIIPIYSNKNLLKIKLNCIISLDLTQYIYKLIFDFRKIKIFDSKRY